MAKCSTKPQIKYRKNSTSPLILVFFLLNLTLSFPMEIIIIAAMAQNRVIGHNNSIPWNIPEEMQFFKKTTMGHAVIMGRKTFESIAVPLSGRLNVVLSRKSRYHAPGCFTSGSLATGIEYCTDHKKIFIIGGRSLYQEAMAIVDTILLSILDREYQGDTYFPSLPMKQFIHVSEQRQETSNPFTIHTYQRKRQ